MTEFDMKLGSAGKGVIASILALLKFLVIPYLMVIAVGAANSNFDEDWTPVVEGLLDDMVPLIMIFGIALAVLSFPRGFYPKGSVPRLIFSVVCAALVIVFGYMLTLGGDVQGFFDSQEIELDIQILFVLFVVLIELRAFQHIGELPDNRREFLVLRSKKLGTKMPEPIPVEDPEKHEFWHDFKARYGRWSDGFKEARRSAAKYVVWPVFFLIIAGIMVTKVGEQVPVEFKNELDSLVALILLLGAIITVLLFFKGFYPKGSVSRMAFWVVAVAFACLWLWFLSFGGDVAIEIMDVATVDLDYTPIVLLFILAVALWAVYAIVEMVSYRDDWKKNNFQPIDEKKIKAKKKLESQEAKQKAKAEQIQKKLDEMRKPKE